MGIVIKQGVRNTVVTYLGVLIGAVNLLYIFPKLLKPEEIGLTRVLIDLALMMASFTQLGASSITDRFFPFFRDDKLKHKGFFLMLLIYPFLGFLILIILFFFLQDIWVSAFESKSPMLIDYYYYILPLTFFIMYQQVLEAYCRAHFKIVIPGFVREIFLRIFLTAIVLLYFLKVINLDQLVVLLIISYAFAMLILFFYIKFLKKLFIDSFSFIATAELRKEMLLFSSLFVVVSALTFLATKADVLFLSSMKGLGYAGVYSIAFYIGTVIEIPKRSISQISTPIIAQFWKNNEIKNIENIYKKSSLNQLIIGLFLFLIIWGSVDFILEILPNAEIYKAGKYVILFIGLSRVIDMGMGSNVEIIASSQYYRFNFILSVVSGVLVAFTNYYFIGIYGINGAALSILVNVAAVNLFRLFYIYHKVNIQPFGRSTWIIVLISSLTLALLYYTPIIPAGKGFINAFINIILRSLLVLVCFIGVVFYSRFSEDFNNIVLKGLRSIGIRAER